MSSDPIPQRRLPLHGDAKLVSYDEFIDTQVESTRRLVKLVDLATSLVVLAAGVLAFLLAAVVAEHWLVPGGYPVAVRATLFALLAGGVIYFAYRRLWPLAVRAINPVYAALAIEQAGPSLKNSLINLLLFRQRRGEISDAVYETLEEQAARRLCRVPVEAAVDRSLLIRVGKVLLAIVAVGLLYTVLSPKDPFVAAQRVLMPWANIMPASRVSILHVEPGSVTVSRGEFIQVSAEVRGIGDNDPVLLRITTDDGQAVDNAIPMRPSKDGRRFEARVPQKDDAAADLGVTQNLQYRVEAGDARSLDYRVRVVAAPSILVERVDYDYPDYTGDLDRHVDGLGDIRAIEGTRVTIHARANGPIRQAHVDFDADGRRDLEMSCEGARGRASFVLRLRDDRQTPEHASYVLRFTDEGGRTNRDPVKHAIHVAPDIAPEARILAPEENELQVRLDESVTIDVEASDQDFALAEVRLVGEVAGREVWNESLLNGAPVRRFTGRRSFTPAEHGLHAGDAMHYWVTANDNRTPQPNTAASERKMLRVISPDPAQQPPPDRVAQRDSPPPHRQPPPPDGDAQRSRQEGQADKQTGPQAEGENGEAGETGDQQPAPQQRQARPDDKNRTDDQSGTQGGGSGAEPTPPAANQPPEQPVSGHQPAAAPSNAARGERTADGPQQQADDKKIADDAPVSSQGDNDAEAFERIRRHLQRDGKLPEADSDPAKQNGDNTGRNGDNDARPEGASKRQEPGQSEERAEDRGQSSADSTEPPADARGKKESDSTGEQGGDQAGGGQQGGGQDAPRQGTGSAGQHEAADKGAGESTQPGAGTDSPNAGGDVLADRRAGKSSDAAKGRGSVQREGEGQKPGRDDGSRDAQESSRDAHESNRDAQEFSRDAQEFSRDAQESNRDAQEFSRDAQRSAKEQGDKKIGRQPEDGAAGGEDAPARARDEQSDDAHRTGAASGGGGERGTAAARPPQAGDVPPGDEANLEYARKQTDLVLEKLSDQLRRKQVDDELLKELGWSEEDLQRFVARWQVRKDAAQRDDPAGEAAQRELDDALRSLGLRRGPLRQGPLREDTLRDLREGYRGAVPLEYQERLRAYNEGVSRARGKDESPNDE
jgi:hypothetical protein